jgi:hypothetical protein
MAEHEPLDAASKDTSTKPRPKGTTDLTAAASEAMDLQRLPDAEAHVPPGRKRTGDPPTARSKE